jgi:outer membrane protein OmpA-like peptidoglycan-associated protein
VTGSTKIEVRKSNPFRGAMKYEPASLVRGLTLEVEGRGNNSGVLVADKIRITDTDFKVARSIESRVDPVETRVTSTEDRVSAAEQNAQRLSGQLDELAAVANTAKGGAKAAQETADAAMNEAKSANQRVTQTNERVTAVDERVSSVDDYEAKSTITINFKVRSATLSAEAKTALDELANQAKNEKGYVIQVSGFASADGSEALNRNLSERRANAVIRYLIENHDVSQRRIITPYGFGELKPAGDNATREGRQQNRRVEVAILVSKGLSSPVAADKSTSTSGDAQRQRTSNVPQ